MDACVRCARKGTTSPAGLCTPCAASPLPNAGSYELLKELHRGEAAALFLGWHPESRRHVAVKILAPMNEARKKRFLREAKGLAALRHPHLMPIHDFGTLPAGPLPGHYIVTDYVPGSSLAESKLPVKKELELLLQVAEALSLAHKKNILHRDLKPSNILVDAEGRGRLSDFNLDRPEEGEKAPAPAGSPHYMSPEQARGESKLTPASDVYSLGATLYFLLTGVPPFAEARSFSEYLSLVAVTRPLAPSHLNREISKDYESLVFKSMDSNLEKRIAKADEFAKLLREAIRKGTVPAGIIRKRAGLSAVAGGKPALPSASRLTPEMARQIDARLEPIETLLSLAEQTNRKISANEGTNLEQTLKGCLVLYPGNPKPHVLLGRLYILLTRTDEAIESLNQAIALGPDLIAPLHHRAMLRLQQLQLGRSLPQVQVTESGIDVLVDASFTPEEEELRRQALEDLRALTDQYGATGDPLQFFTRGVQELFGSDAEIGYELLKRAAELLPQNPDPSLYFGIACLFRRDVEKAVEALNKAVALRRSGLLLRYLVLGYETLGRLKKNKGEDPSEAYREALKHSDDRVKLESDGVDAWVQRAALLLSTAEALTRLNLPCTREVREALEITRKMLEKHPDAAPFYNIRGDIRRALAETRLERGETPSHLLDQAISEYRRALEIDPKFFPGLLNLSSVLLLKSRASKAGRKELIQQALSLCTQARELKPGHSEPLALGGRCRMELGETDGAIEDWQEAARANPAQAARFEDLIGRAKKARGGAAEDP